eukprot:2535136-Prymnesium_polylepis.1
MAWANTMAWANVVLAARECAGRRRLRCRGSRQIATAPPVAPRCAQWRAARPPRRRARPVATLAARSALGPAAVARSQLLPTSRWPVGTAPD